MGLTTAPLQPLREPFKPSIAQCDTIKVVSYITPELVRNCKRCSHDLPPGALTCDQCHALVYADQLDRIAEEAHALEGRGAWLQARDRWLSALPLLPHDSTQRGWIQKHARELEIQASKPQQQPGQASKWAKRLAPLGPIGVLLAKAKWLLAILPKLKFFLTFASSIALYWAVFGAKFGVGVAFLILIHEMGHYIDVKRRGLPADMPVFLPGIGAYVRWQAMGVSLDTRAAVSLAGPLAGWFAAALCVLLWFQTGNPLWAALGQFSAWLNILNLIPVWVLDGSQAVLPLSRIERIALVIGCAAMALLLRQELFYLVAAGAAFRLFTGDVPEQPSPRTTAYFLIVLTLLGLVRLLVLDQVPPVR